MPFPNPYYKLAYIKLAWGGPEEQAAEIASENLNAKDWQDEARKLIEKTVSHALPLPRIMVLTTTVHIYNMDQMAQYYSHHDPPLLNKPIA